MKSKSIIQLLLFLLCSITSAKGQNCTYKFSGVVEDFHDKSPITGATVLIKSQNKYTATDIEGKFTIENICSGKISVEISHVACETKIIEIDVTKNMYKIIDLEHHTEELNEVSVNASLNKKTQTAQETLLKTDVIEKYTSASLGDALKDISGVSSLNTGNTIVKPVINGMHSSRVLISFNNVRLQDQEWGIEHAPNIDINTATSISVIKGANALQFGGDAIGGVVIINPDRSIKTDTLYGKTIISQQDNGNLFSATSSVHAVFKSPWYIDGQASYKRAGDFNAANYNLTNTGINARSFTIGTGFKRFDKGFELFYSNLYNELGILSASHIGNVVDLVNAINSTTPFIIEDFSYTINNPKQKVTHQLFKANAFQRYKGFGKVTVQYDYQNNRRLEFDKRRGENKNLQAVDLTLKTHTFKGDVILDSNTANTYKFGFNAGYQNNFSDPVTKVRRLIPDYDRVTFGTYAIGNFKFNNFIVEAGLRYDMDYMNAKKFYLKSRWEAEGYAEDFGDIVTDDTVSGSQILTNPIFTFHNISASLGATYMLNANNSLIVNYGLANRAPNAAELFSDGLHHSAARFEIGDLRLHPETSNRFGVSYLLEKSKLNATLEAFYNHVSDYIYLEPSGIETTIRGSFPVWRYKQINAQLFGIDTNLTYAFNSNVSFGNKTAYINGRDLSEKRALIDVPPFKTVSTIKYTKGNWHNFYIALEHEYNARQNKYPDNNFDTFIPTTGEYETVDISTPPGAYHLLHFNTGVQFSLSETNLALNLSIRNLSDTAYRNYMNQQRFYADDLGRSIQIQVKINY